jgi:hypothetical protein
MAALGMNAGRSAVGPVRGDRLGDFAGRYAETVDAMEVTEEGGVAVILHCLYTHAYRLFWRGMLFRRPYGRPCHRRAMPFQRDPGWTGPWSAWPAR